MTPTRVLAERQVAGAQEVRNAIELLLEPILSQVSEGNTCIVGIQTGGVHVANRLLSRLHQRGIPRPPVGILDITLYRDDIFIGRQQPIVRQTDIPFELSGKNVILVDDVLFTGRTIRAALDALVDFGRPASIRLAVLVDRGLREYPIQADWVGMKIPTVIQETVRVELVEMGLSDDRVVVYTREA
ncbi:MAG TPA: bifunctional pyr operon transcriptional regulator/uracil phosphoribosyltransferase PyrR [Myxococcota bacterium]|jgi:pyrimidine operon attenuation protein/uracil phosphoribosyltransferase|nr:bifunctional pyr operon transcriptional regulator/uracil phosphoribosyltransferase PyrR [Myxococcota bacterium]OQC43070.1 MAG: Bifunctional protein PyrR [Deltaproteobacteria bacterium ADurb.Bin058]HHW95846.1 bifunctional pyr operon transcriptional regulator/uracil phosphoribosyltransferase PyrR [Oligoflexales bacterium]MBP8971985.1 bifunctional pyr operon transcriptional regulator/uracil phosphoribosyltransferase PyrR [Myxococcota bacterium]HQC45609.1 bifunctional pyr operon transcriptional 